jgi:chorismate mutase
MPDQRELATLRDAMDDVNRRLRDVLQERGRLVLRIGEWKRSRGMLLVDVAREAEMLAAVLREPGEGYGPGALERLFRAVLAESRALLEVASVRGPGARPLARRAGLPAGSARAPTTPPMRGPGPTAARTTPRHAGPIGGAPPPAPARRAGPAPAPAPRGRPPKRTP